MKHYKYFYLISIVLFAFASCGLDNYDAPKSKLVGKITYNGESIGVRGTGEAVQLQLYQDGYELKDNIRVYVGQDGTFDALLFDGEYKMVTRDKNGPWVNNRDTLVVKVKGATTVELPVTPYFTISNESFSFSTSSLSASLNIKQIVNTAEIDYVTLLISKTSFVDDVSNIARKDFKGQLPGSVNLSMDIAGNKNVESAKALFARVGVRTKGSDQAIYGKIERIR